MYSASKSKVSDLPVIIHPYTCISFPVLRGFFKKLNRLSSNCKLQHRLFLFGYIYLTWSNWSWVRILMPFYKPYKKGAPNMILWSILHVGKSKITDYCNHRLNHLNMRHRSSNRSSSQSHEVWGFQEQGAGFHMLPCSTLLAVCRPSWDLRTMSLGCSTFHETFLWTLANMNHPGEAGYFGC